MAYLVKTSFRTRTIWSVTRDVVSGMRITRNAFGNRNPFTWKNVFVKV